MISSTRKIFKGRGFSILPGCIFNPLFCILCVSGGCLKESQPVGAVDKSPLIVDEAMQQRHWPVSVAHIQNGETPAQATGFALEHAASEPKLLPVLTDTPMFLENILLLPIDFAINPPWDRVIYQSGVVEPSYTGIPPVPPKEKGQ